MRKSLLLSLVLACVPGCANRGSDDQHRARVEQEMKSLISTQLERWLAASKELQEAAPVTTGRGWDAAADAAAITRMKEAWGRARVAYELVEGAVAPTFPESDAATDARYDDFLAKIGPTGDQNLFDGEGVVGMHAIERILWADRIPPEVITFEKGLPGYRPALFPANEAEARAFKSELAARMVRDVEKLASEFRTLNLDVAFAFRGLIDLAVEQAEKVDKAATGQEESRYSELTMRDLRANYQGCLNAYALFRPWVLSKPDGEAYDRAVEQAFARLARAYEAVPGDSIPKPPASWSSVAPSARDRATPFGTLFSVVEREANDQIAGSLHQSLLGIAKALEMPEIVVR